MLRNLRIQLTLICVITTGILMSAIAVGLLWMSERQMDNQSNVTFQNNINSIVYRIQSSRIIDDLWLSQLETGNSLIVHIEDNATPILFSGSWIPKTDRAKLIKQVHEAALAEHNFDVRLKPYSIIDVSSISFGIAGDHGDRYQAAVVSIPSSTGWQSLTILRNIDGEIQQRNFLRFAFVCLILITLLILFLFSLWFSKRAIRPIEESNQKQVEFVAAASHELRSPLSVVRASLSTLAITESRQEIAKYTAVADKECVRMSHLIDDLLFLASADAMTWSVHFKPVEIDTLLMEIYEAFLSVTRKKGLKLNLNLPSYTIPEFNGDQERLWQALTIFLDNAVAYTPEGGQITLSVESNRKTIDITIADSGIGIPDDAKAKVFDRFYRADSSHSKKEHYGLGLSVAKEIVELHHGRISVTDTPGGGATFHVRLSIQI